MIHMNTYYLATVIWILFSVVIFFALLKITVPYGRHARRGWGPVLSERIGWLFMEFPSVAVMPLLYAFSPAVGAVVPLLFLLLWQLHYINRTFIYPFRIRGSRKLMPLYVALMDLAAQGFLFHNDDTPAKILAVLKKIKQEDLERKGLFTTGVVSVLSNRKIALYFTANRHAGENLKDLLERRKGTVRKRSKEG